MQLDFNYSDERFADLQMLRYRLKGWDELSLEQKKYIYFLAKATLMGRDITTDQQGCFNLQIRKALESAVNLYKGDRESSEFKELIVYLKRVWFSNGIHHHYGCDKFIPNFSENFLRKVFLSIGAENLPLKEGETIEDFLDTIMPVIFDKNIMTKRVSRNPDTDVIKASACNYYENVSQDEAHDYYEKKAQNQGDAHPSYGLNSKLVKENGELKEKVWHIGGMYSNAIEQIVYWLNKAKEVAENDEEKQIINLLISYYKTGDLKTFDDYSIAWLQQKEGDVDFINGFIEVYGDPIGIKGSWEGLVEYVDEEATKRTKTISENAKWFEDHSPINPRFRKSKVKGVSAKVINAAMLGGDEYPSSAIGINLPNADWIRAQYGSKSVTIGNLTEAYDKAAHGNGFYEEYVIDKDTLDMINKYGDQCDDLHTDLHECLGHGSGQLLPGVDPNAMKSYASTIEEARADLFGLYYIADEKLIELGLLKDKDAYKSQYYTYIMNGLLTQLVRINIGAQIEEDHMRNRALIAYWVLDHADGAVELIKRENKTYVKINDYEKLRKLFATLLAEIQRIKSEGDYESAKNLVEKYAIKIDSELHKEIKERYSKLNIAPYKGFINPWLKPVKDENGEITDVEVDYTETYSHQMMRYSKEYATL
ncbi:MAG: dipeptidyl peptidase 3 [Prevotella sp.]|nr:dipeptidyl peptidase 3 [Prevotella sp.]